MGVLSVCLVALEQRALVLASADLALEQWKWFGADGVCTAGFGCFSTGAKGGRFLYHWFGASLFWHWGKGHWYRGNWLQLWSNGAVGAVLHAIGLGYGEMGAG